MEIKKLLKNKIIVKEKGGSWWTDIVGRFHERLKDDYKLFRGKELTVARVAQKLAPFKNSHFDLEWFYKEAEKSGNFGKYFWSRTLFSFHKKEHLSHCKRWLFCMLQIIYQWCNKKHHQKNLFLCFVHGASGL